MSWSIICLRSDSSNINIRFVLRILSRAGKRENWPRTECQSNPIKFNSFRPSTYQSACPGVVWGIQVTQRKPVWIREKAERCTSVARVIFFQSFSMNIICIQALRRIRKLPRPCWRCGLQWNRIWRSTPSLYWGKLPHHVPMCWWWCDRVLLMSWCMVWL